MTNYFEGSSLTYNQRSEYKCRIRERDNYTCQLCGGYGDQVDHIIPWKVSHDNSPENLRVLCRPCNLATRRERYDANLPLDQWYEQIELELASIS